jgi:hypothetical protein
MHFEISLDQYSSFQNTNVIPKKASILFRVQHMCCLMCKMHTFFGMTYQGRTGYLKGARAIWLDGCPALIPPQKKLPYPILIFSS